MPPTPSVRRLTCPFGVVDADAWIGDPLASLCLALHRRSFPPPSRHIFPPPELVSAAAGARAAVVVANGLVSPCHDVWVMRRRRLLHPVHRIEDEEIRHAGIERSHRRQPPIAVVKFDAVVHAPASPRVPQDSQ